MAARVTPSQLLEIRRVKAMVAGAGTMDGSCFTGPAGPTGPTGPAGLIGNYGIPASLGYYNDTTFPQLVPYNMPTVVTWANMDPVFSQGTTGLGYGRGQFFNSSATDNILLNVTGFISFFPNTSGNRSVYARLNGVNSDLYGYTQVSAVNNSNATVVQFSFNIFIKASAGVYNYFEILATQTATPAGTSLTINNSTSRICMTRINTTMQGIQGIQGPPGITAYGGPTGPTGAPGDPGPPGNPLGNVLHVDSLLGLAQGIPNSTPYASLENAISDIRTIPLTSPQTIWLLPGTYTLTGTSIAGSGIIGNVGISIPPNCSIRGISAQTVIIEMTATTNTTMIVMGENTRIEDCTIRLLATTQCDLTAILFYGTSAFTSKIKGCIITVDNSSLTSATTDVIGILANGVTAATPLQIEQANAGSLACVEDSTINVFSNDIGTKRGIMVGGGTALNTNIMTIKNTNINLANPRSSPSGSYAAVETNSPTCKLQCYTSIISGPTQLSAYDFADVSQTYGQIVIGEGTTLVNKRARSKPFTALSNVTVLNYTAIGKISNFPVNTLGYLLPGSMMIQNYQYPPLPAAALYNFQYPTISVESSYHKITKKSILMATTVRLKTAQSTIVSPPHNQIFVTVYLDTLDITGASGSHPNPTSLFTIVVTDIEVVGEKRDTTYYLPENSQLRVSVQYMGSATNYAEDLFIQLELY